MIKILLMTLFYALIVFGITIVSCGTFVIIKIFVGEMRGQDND